MSAKGFVFVILALFAIPASAQEPSSPSPSRPGSSVTTSGSGFDPSENVKALSEAANKRQDDLRAAESTVNELRYSSLKEIIALRGEYEDKLRRAEAGRLDAIRLVDTTTLSIDRERTTATAQTLQKKVDDSALVLSANAQKNADDLVKLVKTTADEQSRNLQQQFTGIQSQFTDVGKRLTSLEQTGAEGLGKTKYQDPQQAQILAALQATVAKLNEKNDTTTGAGIGRGEIVAYAISAIMLLLAVLQYMSRVSVPPASISPIFKPRGARVSSKT